MRYYESVAQFGSIRLCMHHLFLFCLWLAMVSIVGLTSLICVIYRLNVPSQREALVVKLLSPRW